MVALPSPELPREITILQTLALDLLWTWSHERDALWSYVDAQLWEKTRNPWVVLQSASMERLNELARDRKFLDQLSNLMAARERYLQTPGWFRCSKDGSRLGGSPISAWSLVSVLRFRSMRADWEFSPGTS